MLHIKSRPGYTMKPKSEVEGIRFWVEHGEFKSKDTSSNNGLYTNTTSAHHMSHLFRL
jgi:hypothetical protein